MSAEQAKAAAAENKPAAAEKKEKTPKKKKSQPTNCVQCNVRIRRKSWFYHNQKYFCGPNCSKAHLIKLQEEKAKAAAAAAAASAPKENETASEAPKAA